MAFEQKPRKSTRYDRYNFWVVDGPKTYGYLNEAGEVNTYFDFKTKAKAQAALDLYLEKQKPADPNALDCAIKTMREFEHGATRDSDAEKLDYEGFNNPLVDKCYGQYLYKHQQTANGLRDSDNWQTLFGNKHLDVCIKALCRHVIDARLAHRGYVSEQPIIDSLCAVIFNAKAYLLKLLLDAEDYDAAIDHEMGIKTITAPGYEGDVDRTKPVPNGY